MGGDRAEPGGVGGVCVDALFQFFNFFLLGMRLHARSGEFCFVLDLVEGEGC